MSKLTLKVLLVLVGALALAACASDDSELRGTPPTDRLIVLGPRGDTIMNIVGRWCSLSPDKAGIRDPDGFYQEIRTHDGSAQCRQLPRTSK